MRGYVGGSVLAVVAFAAATGVAAAQGSTERLVPPGWSVGHVRIEGGPTHSSRSGRVAAARADERPLTVRRPPDAVPDDDDDPLWSGGTHYDHIRTFNPFPSVTSGTQLPYGLDGVGGYGSDIGFSAGANASDYFRGP